ncbi:MAG: hypothetical protein LUC93_11060 [Planctomycetaceae bacterium]|nr:hypothetical protein [Planctomycetaceae bacterium]
MKASEGKLGRVFLVNLEEGDNPAETIERFAIDNGIHAAQVVITAEDVVSGMITPDADGNPGLRLSACGQNDWNGAQVVVQELLGISFRRRRDDEGRETLYKVVSTKTRVMEKPAPAPEENGPGTIPVYLFNAEFN